MINNGIWPERFGSQVDMNIAYACHKQIPPIWFSNFLQFPWLNNYNTAVLACSLSNSVYFRSNTAYGLVRSTLSIESDNDPRIKDAELPSAVSKVKLAMGSIEKIATAWVFAVLPDYISKENVSIVAIF